MGSTTEVPGTILQGGRTVEINPVEGIKNSANKRRMKDCFTLGGVKTADWFITDGQQLLAIAGPEKNPEPIALDKLTYPVIAKQVYGSRGTGNYKLDDQAAVERFLQTRKADLKEFIFEKYYNYSKEYRLHVTEDGCFYTCRKALKKDADKDKQWQRHDHNCVWFVEDNPSFDKPVNWDKIVAECVKGLAAVELDVASFDVRVQSAKTEKGKDRKEPDFIILECNSASSFGDNSPNSIVAQRYMEMIPKIANKKAVEYGVIKATTKA